MNELLNRIIENECSGNSETTFFSILSEDFVKNFWNNQQNNYTIIKFLDSSFKHSSIVNKTLIIVITNKKSVVYENEKTVQLKEIIDFRVIDINKYLREFSYGLDLNGINLKGINLKGANFTDCNLKGANFKGADLEGAIFKNSNLEESNFEGANLSRTNFYGSNLKNADLRRTNLRHSELRNTIWEGVALRGAELYSANIWNVNFKGAFTDGVDLSRADKRGND